MALLYSAAERANVHKQDLEFIRMAELKAGGLSMHDGRTWYGSSGNQSMSKTWERYWIAFCSLLCALD